MSPQSQPSFAGEDSTPGGSWEPKFVRIGAQVGRSGQVFETDEHVGLEAVAKLFTWAAGRPEQVVQQFTREAMTVAELRHPHIVQVFDAGTLGDGTPFVVMERLAGTTLEEAAKGRSLPIAEVLPILRGIGAALGATHAMGLAHGELRADNVFLADADGAGRAAWPKLLDFGVARLAASARPGLELGGRAGERADQLGLAAVAWRLLGATSTPAIQRVLVRAMAPDPSQRFGSIAALIAGLEEASAAGRTTNPNAVTVLLGGVNAAAARWPAAVAPPGGPAVARPRAAAPAAQPAVAPAPLVPSPSRQPPAPQQPPPSSLTQQFFAAGDQLEAAHATGRASGPPAAANEVEDEGDAPETVAVPRVPRSRLQMTLVSLLALASVFVIGWTLISLATKTPGAPPTAVAAPVTTVSRPADVPAAAPPRATGATDRSSRGTPAAARRAPRLPTAPTEPPRLSATVAAPVPAATPAPASPPPTEAASRKGDHAAPEPAAASAASPAHDDDEAEPEEQAAAEAEAATPPPGEAGDAIRPPRAWGDPAPPPQAPAAP